MEPGDDGHFNPQLPKGHLEGTRLDKAILDSVFLCERSHDDFNFSATLFDFSFHFISILPSLMVAFFLRGGRELFHTLLPVLVAGDTLTAQMCIPIHVLRFHNTNSLPWP